MTDHPWNQITRKKNTNQDIEEGQIGGCRSGNFCVFLLKRFKSFHSLQNKRSNFWNVWYWKLGKVPTEQLNDLLEIFLLQVANGLVNFQSVGQLHVLWGLHLVNAPVVPSWEGVLDGWRDDLGSHHDAVLSLRFPAKCSKDSRWGDERECEAFAMNGLTFLSQSDAESHSWSFPGWGNTACLPVRIKNG